MKEIWKKIPGYESYEISTLGRLKNIKTNKILKNYEYKNGYQYTKLKNKKSSIKIHQLMAITFLGHKLDGSMKIVINHINGIKNDNRLENLELCSCRYNSSSRKNKTSKYTGVCLPKNSKKYVCNIFYNKKNITLGSYLNEEDAGRIYLIALYNLDKYKEDKKEFKNIIIEKFKEIYGMEPK